MAKILPEASMLPSVEEFQPVDFRFTYSLDANETLKHIKIIRNNFPQGITVQNERFFGSFINIFSLPEGALKYRQGDQLKSASSFKDLPPKGTIDIYSYIAPRTMQEDFNCKVELSYTKEDPLTGTKQDSTISKDYIQRVLGNWNIFADQFLAYVR